MIWAASICFPTLAGSGAELLEAINDEEVRAEWETYFGDKRRPIFTVAHQVIADKAEQRKLSEELAKQQHPVADDDNGDAEKSLHGGVK